MPRINVYDYFPTKESIYTAVIEHIEPERDPREVIAAYIRAKLEHSRLHAAESRSLISRLARHPLGILRSAPLAKREP